MQRSNKSVRLMGSNDSASHLMETPLLLSIHWTPTVTENWPFTASSKCRFLPNKNVNSLPDSGYFKHERSTKINKDSSARHHFFSLLSVEVLHRFPSVCSIGVICLLLTSGPNKTYKLVCNLDFKLQLLNVCCFVCWIFFQLCCN